MDTSLMADDFHESEAASTSTNSSCSSGRGTYLENRESCKQRTSQIESCESGVESLRERLGEFDTKKDRSGTPTSHPALPIVRCASISNDYVRLMEILSNIDGDDLKEILQRRLRKKDSKAVVALSLLLPRSKFPPINNVHCVRCHKNYNPRQQAHCTVRHPNSSVVKTSQDINRANFHCRCCKKDFSLIKMYFYDEAVNSYMTGFCFQGDHTTNPLEVIYGGAVKTCEEQGCMEFYV